MRHWALWLTLIGCTGTAENGVDFDLDGVPEGTDCDDSNGLVYPNAEEICDNLDNDCDGDVDEDVTTISYADEDDDGFGNPLTGAPTCGIPAGRTYDNKDCDDDNSDISPLADEVCDGFDNDCDGDIDLDAVTGGTTLYADTDGDGYGDQENAINLCLEGDELPEGWVYSNKDCDDTDEDVHPFAQEVCDDIDNDCANGTDIDAADESKWYLDDDGDGFGSDQYVEACAPPNASYVSNENDCDDTKEGVNPSETEICDGIDNDCDQVVDTDAPSPPRWYLDDDGDNYGVVDSFVDTCNAPPDHVALGTDCNDNDSSIHPQATEICLDGFEYEGIDQDCDGIADANELVCPELHAGYITEDETWTSERSHLVFADLVVDGPNEPTLTIEDGADVEFVDQVQFFVGETGPAHAVLGEATLYSSGDWSGVGVGFSDGSVTLEGTTISQALWGVLASSPNGHITAFDAQFLDVFGAIGITDSTAILDGITVDGEVGVFAFDTLGVELENSTLETSGFGAVCSPGPCFTSLEGNTISNGDIPLLYDPAYLTEIGGNQYTNNANNRIYLAGPGYLNNPIWPAFDLPLHANEGLHWTGTLSVADGTEITVGDGIAIEGDSLFVRNPAAGVSLNLVQGGSGFSVDLGDYQASHSVQHLHVQGGDLVVMGDNLVISDVTVQDAPDDALTIAANTVDVANVTVDGAGMTGIEMSAVYASLFDVDILDVGFGLLAETTALTIGDVAVQGSDNVGMALYTYQLSVPSPLTAVDVDSYPLHLAYGDASLLVSLNGGHTWSSNDPSTNVILFSGDPGVYTSGVIENPGAPIYLPNGLYINPNVQLQIDQTQLRFGNSQGLFVGNGGSGTLISNNSVFTSASIPPAAGQWRGITYNAGSTGSLNAVTISYAGDPTYAPSYGLYLGGITSLVPLQGVSIQYLPATAYGIFCNGGCPNNYPTPAQATFVSVANPHN